MCEIEYKTSCTTIAHIIRFAKLGSSGLTQTAKGLMQMQEAKY